MDRRDIALGGFALLMVCSAVIGHPTVYMKRNADLLSPVLVPVSSTVVPLPIYKVGYSVGTGKKIYDPDVKLITGLMNIDVRLYHHEPVVLLHDERDGKEYLDTQRLAPVVLLIDPIRNLRPIGRKVKTKHKSKEGAVVKSVSREDFEKEPAL